MMNLPQGRLPTGSECMGIIVSLYHLWKMNDMFGTINPDLTARRGPETTNQAKLFVVSGGDVTTGGRFQTPFGSENLE